MISQYVHRLKQQLHSKKQGLQQYLDHKGPQPDTDMAGT